MDTNVRVLVANRPRLMRELVLSTLSEQAGIHVVDPFRPASAKGRERDDLDAGQG